MPRPGHAEVALITGFPACYARRIVEHVLDTGAFVYIVVPPIRLPDAMMTLATIDPSGKRTSVIEGDPAAMDLGLSGAEFRQVTREVDIIHHAAHRVHGGLDDDAATQANVVTAGEIVELARASSSLGCLVFHSTTAVAGDRTGMVYEADLEARQAFHDNIEKTRMRAEQVARGAMKDIPIAIVRPSHVVGASDPLDQPDTLHVATLLALATPAEITLPLPHKGDAPVHVVPMDFVARASHAIAHMQSAVGKTFHLVDPHPLTARRFFQVVLRAAKKAPLALMTENAVATLLRTPGIENIVRHPKSFLEKLASPVRYDASAMTSLLAKTGIDCPPVETYVDLLIAEVFEHVRCRDRTRSLLASLSDAGASDPFV